MTKSDLARSPTLQRFDKEVTASETLSEIVADVTAVSGVHGSGEAGLKVAAHVPARSLYFKKENKRHNERVIFITALFDMQNHYLAGTEAVMDMKLMNAKFAQISRDGVNAAATLQVPPGRYRLRATCRYRMRWSRRKLTPNARGRRRGCFFEWRLQNAPTPHSSGRAGVSVLLEQSRAG